MLLLATAQLWLTLWHVPWQDELQAWLIVKGSPSLSILFANLKYEGHPALWYLLLWPVSALTGDVKGMAILQAGIALGTLALIWRSPFKPAFRVMLAGSYLIIFEYGAIARSYGVGAFLFFAFLSFRERRWVWLILSLMAAVAVHFLLLSIACAAVLIFERRSVHWTAAVWVAGCLVTVLTIYPPPPDVQKAVIMPSDHLAGFAASFASLSTIVFPIMPGRFPVLWGGGAPFALQPFLAMIPFVAAPLSLRDRPWWMAIYLGLLAALLLIGTFVYPLYPRHLGTLFLLYIGFEWMRGEARIVAVVWTATLFVCGLWMAAAALFQPFAPSAEIAKAIMPIRSPIAAYPGSVGLDVTGMTGQPTFNVQALRWNVFMRWNYSPAPLAIDEAVNRARASGAHYLLTDDPKAAQVGIAPIGRFRSMQRTVWLYRI